MKRALFVVLVSACLGAPARAEEEARWYASVDYFFATNAGEGFREAAQATTLGSMAPGAVSLGDTNSTGDGIGGTLGYLYPISRKWELGPSVAWLSGPGSEASQSVVNGNKNAYLTDLRSTQFVRVLADAFYTIPVSRGEEATLKLGGGVGLGVGFMRDDFDCIGAACVAPSQGFSRSQTWTGFAWELAPRFQLEQAFIGLRVAGFPPVNDKRREMPEFEWTTWGLYTGIAF